LILLMYLIISASLSMGSSLLSSLASLINRNPSWKYP
jgi:hypothetical protein